MATATAPSKTHRQDRTEALAAHNALVAEIAARQPLPYVSVEVDVQRSISMRRDETAGDFIRAELHDFDPEHDPDRAVWHGDRILAVLHRGDDGHPMATRFDTDCTLRILELADQLDHARALEVLEAALEGRAQAADYERAAREADWKRGRKVARRQRVSGFKVTDDFTELRYEAAPGLTTERFLAEELERARRWPGNFESERAVWRDGMLVGVIAYDVNGDPTAINLDETPFPAATPTPAKS
jgi:hypothetical protein